MPFRTFQDGRAHIITLLVLKSVNCFKFWLMCSIRVGYVAKIKLHEMCSLFKPLKDHDIRNSDLASHVHKAGLARYLKLNLSKSVLTNSTGAGGEVVVDPSSPSGRALPVIWLTQNEVVPMKTSQINK